ncbi:substrate-binding domain-containing protein [Tissierellaceae bacterium HCP3S3_D8]
MKKIIILSLMVVMVFSSIVGCSSNEDSTIPNNTINVVSREDGSGTRGAFVEIVGVLEKDESGNEVDRTYDEAIIQNGTNAVMTTVQGDKYSIGYISLGSLNDMVKAVNISGVEATADNVQKGWYKIARPFNIAYTDTLSPLGKDFLDFILSTEGQAIVTEEGYIQVNTDLPKYDISDQEGSLVVAGSTSVTPVMEKLAEAYENLNSNVSIEIQSTGSSAGIQSAIDGSADIGMASRELKDSEKEKLSYATIAIDGIAVIVNKENIVENIDLEDIKAIYIGEITNWNEIVK